MKPHESLHHFDIKDVGQIVPESATFEFDPKKELTAWDWDEIIHNLSRRNPRRYYGEDWMGFAFAASNMAVIDREQTQLLIKNNDWKSIVNELEDSRPTGNKPSWLNFIHLASSLSVINPERARPLVTEKDREGMTAYVRNTGLDIVSGKEGGDVYNYASMLSELFELDHDRARSSITEDGWEKVIEFLQNYGPTIALEWLYFTRMASEFAVLDPDRIRPLITSADWAKMVAQLPFQRPTSQGGWSDFASMTASLVRLSHLLKQKPEIDTSRAPLPVVKKY